MKVIKKVNTLKIIKGTKIWRTVLFLCWLVYAPLAGIFLGVGFGDVRLGVLSFLVVSFLFLLGVAYLKPLVITVDKLNNSISFNARYSLLKKNAVRKLKISDVKGIYVKQDFVIKEPNNIINITLSLKTQKIIFSILALCFIGMTLGVLIIIILSMPTTTFYDWIQTALMFLFFLLILDYKLVRSALDPKYAASHELLPTKKGLIADHAAAQQRTYYNVIFVLTDASEINVSKVPGIDTSIHIKRDMLTIASEIAKFTNINYSYEPAEIISP
jgi:hypothetical protein